MVVSVKASMATAIPVGEPIPPNVPHAVSVSLPHWQDIVDYEEGRLGNTMQTGYPRFFIHRSIQKFRYPSLLLTHAAGAADGDQVCALW